MFMPQFLQQVDYVTYLSFIQETKEKLLKEPLREGKKPKTFIIVHFNLISLLCVYTEGTSLNSYFSCPSNGFISFSTKKPSINSFILNTIADFLF